MEIRLDETWKKVLNLLRDYSIAKAALDRNDDAFTIEEMNESHTALVKAEMQGPSPEDSGLDRLGVDVDGLFEALRIYGTPCKAETRDEGSELEITPLNLPKTEFDSPVKDTLSVEEPAEEESFELDVEHSVEAENVDFWLLRAAERIHGTEGFRATIGTEDGKLLLDYWTEGSTKGNRSILAEAKGDDASSTYNPKLLDPLKGEWNLQLGEDLPLRAEKTIDEGGEGWKADVTVVVAPRVTSAG